MMAKTIQESVNGLENLETDYKSEDTVKLLHEPGSSEMAQFLTESGMFRKNPDDQPIIKTMRDFTEGDFIAKGSFGEVFKARLNDEKFDVALKKCTIKNPQKLLKKPKPVSQEEWYRELTFHINKIRHDHITWLHCFIVQKAMTIVRPLNLYLYLELMNCSFKEILSCPPFESPVLKKITPFKKHDEIDNESFLAFLKHTSSGLAYLHEMDLMHRDIKPGNILLKVEPASKHAVVKLTDFGTVKDYKDTTHEDTTTQKDNTVQLLHTAGVGTTIYSAPEVISISETERYSMSCDLWSLGITSIRLITGYHPVLGHEAEDGNSTTTVEKYCRIISNDDHIFTDLAEKVGLEGDLAKVLGKCMDKEAKNRPKASDVFDIASEGIKEDSDRKLLYDWYTSHDIEKQIDKNRVIKAAAAAAQRRRLRLLSV